MDAGDVAKVLADAAIQFNEQPDELATVRVVLTLAQQIVLGASDVSITGQGRRGRRRTLAAAGAVALEADELQFTLNEGPCLDVADHGEWIRSGYTAVDPRWPSFGPKAADLGVRSLLTIALQSRGKRTGTLNLYSPHRDTFSRTETVDRAVLLSVHAAHALDAAAQIEGLKNALSSRHDIGVAQGIIMERYEVGLERSLDLLRRLSSHRNIKLADLARQIVETGEIPHI